jgi:2-polyprenyl-6-methoxyphenol hydroxylase-like FAD-dependent oxidoreductase
MRAVVVGGGPTGMFCAMALARRGDEVIVVDRDPGPPASGRWARRGVMQFLLPHFFRPIVRQALADALPDVWDALLAAGGVPARPPGFPAELTGLECRRSTFERTVWAAARREPRLALRTGHADRLVTRHGRVGGVVVDGQSVDADLVIAAGGRASRFADDVRPPAEGGTCAFSYVARMYRARPGTELASSGLPMGWRYRGYQVMVFPQDDRTLSALIERPTADEALAPLRHNRCFEAAAPLIPELAPWVDPGRFEPITDVMAGGGLTNTYRGQLDERGQTAIPGLFFAGDTVCTTYPAAGRGVSLGLRQAQALLGMLAALPRRGADLRDVAEQFDAWCTANIRPWYEDHVYWDATWRHRLGGGDIDIEARIPSDVVCAAAEVDPAIWPAAGPYLAMQALPAALDPVQDRARAVLRTGWRPPYTAGPSRDELADACLRGGLRQAPEAA